MRTAAADAAMLLADAAGAGGAGGGAAGAAADLTIGCAAADTDGGAPAAAVVPAVATAAFQTLCTPATAARSSGTGRPAACALLAAFASSPVATLPAVLASGFCASAERTGVAACARRVRLSTGLPVNENGGTGNDDGENVNDEEDPGEEGVKADSGEGNAEAANGDENGDDEEEDEAEEEEEEDGKSALLLPLVNDGAAAALAPPGAAAAALRMTAAMPPVTIDGSGMTGAMAGSAWPKASTAGRTMSNPAAAS